MCSKPRYDFQKTFEDLLKINSEEQVSNNLSGPPMIAVDECINKEEVRNTIQDLCKRGLASGYNNVWDQTRIRNDGSEVTIMPITGQIKHLKRSGVEVGTHMPRSSCDDQRVVGKVISLLAWFNKVVLLSEDLRLDQFGLRRLLTNHIGPFISGSHQSKFSLTTLLKNSTTSLPDYCDHVKRVFERKDFKFGYVERLL
jgi:hypothetical protein